MKGREYIVVENSGMLGEQDVGRFKTYLAASAYLNRAYSDEERDHTHRLCLFPAICAEIDGVRTYEL